MNRTLEIIFEIWELERKWNEIYQPQFTWYGNMSYRKVPYSEMERSIRIVDRQNELKKALRKRIGWWNYIKFCIAPIPFVEKLRAKPLQDS